MIPWIIITIVVLIIILAIIAVFVTRKKGKHEPDYYTFYIIGITWIPLGLATKNYAFFIMGLVFIGIGLANKDKWKKPKLNNKQQKTRMMLFIIIGLVCLIGLMVFYLVKKKILLI